MRLRTTCPPRLPFYFANMFAVEFMAGDGESTGQTMHCFECPGCIVQSAYGLLTGLHRPQGARYPFSPPPRRCMYTYRATCVDLIRREVQRPCHVNEKSAVVRARAELCGNAGGAHVLSVITLTTGVCSNGSFKNVRCNSGGQ